MGEKMDNKELKKIVLDRIVLERERAELLEEIPAVEKKIKKLANAVEEAQSDKEKLENSKINLFFLGVLGKKEERLQQEDNAVRNIRGEFSAAEYELNSIKNRIESIAIELSGTEDLLDEFLALLEGEEGEEIKNCIITLTELSNLRCCIDENIIETKKHLAKAGEIWIYGDIQTDLSGRRYNKKDVTLRNQTRLIQQSISGLIDLLEKYNAVAPEEIKIIYHEDWMDNKDYWANQQIAEDSHARIKKVDDWFYRFETCWNKMKKQQNEEEEILRDEITEFLRY